MVKEGGSVFQTVNRFNALHAVNEFPPLPKVSIISGERVQQVKRVRKRRVLVLSDSQGSMSSNIVECWNGVVQPNAR